MAISELFHSKVDLADAFRTSLTTIDKHTRNPLCPGGRDGPWDREEFASFLAMQNSPLINGSGSSKATQTAATAKALCAVEQHRKLKLANDEKEGKLVDRREVELAWAETLLAIKADIEAIPEKLEMLFPKDIRAQLTLEVRNLLYLTLKQMSESGPQQ